MRQATVSFGGGIDEDWELATFRDAGLLDVEVLSCERDSGVVRIRVRDEVDEQRLEAVDTIEWWERVVSEAGNYVYLVELDVRTDVGWTDTDGDSLPRTERIDVTDEGPTITCVGSQEQIGALVERADANGIDAALMRLRDYRPRETPVEMLTARQQEVLETAFDRGYYDVPRSAPTAEIAAELDLDDSTVSEHLQRAERNVLAAVLGRSG